MNKALSDFFILQIESYEKHRQLILADPDMEDIHQLRLSIKRIRALFELLEALEPENFSVRKQLGKIRHVFQCSSHIRDLQVQQLLLQDFSISLGLSFKKFEKYLTKQEKDSNKLLIRQLKKTTDNSLRSLLPLVEEYFEGTYTKTQTDQKILWAVKHILLSINDREKETLTDDRFHEIRGRLKTAHYLLSLITGKKKELSTLNEMLEKLHLTEELLGKWNDRVVALRLLINFFRVNRSFPGKHNEYLILWEKIHQEYLGLKKEIVVLLKDEGCLG